MGLISPLDGYSRPYLVSTWAGGSSLAQAPFVAMIHPPKIDLGKGWYSIDEGVIALNRKRRRCSPSTTVTS